MNGGLYNRIYEGMKNTPEPKVGMGVTEMCYTDRHAYTIVNILSKTRIEVTHDTVKRIDKNGMSDAQEYEYTSNYDGHRKILRLNKKGQWKKVGSPNGNTYVLGMRKEYYDYSY